MTKILQIGNICNQFTWRDGIPINMALIRMFEAGPEGFIGGLRAKNYMTITGATTPTTTRDLNDLIIKDALFKTGERKTTRYWLKL